LVVTLLTAGALATNCGGGGDYSDEAVAEFMSRCGDILDAERCGCILGHLDDESVTS
jgi:hypothetical protein